jgi:hypothetical protein
MILNVPTFGTREDFVHMVKNPYFEAQKPYAAFCPVIKINTLNVYELGYFS